MYPASDRVRAAFWYRLERIHAAAGQDYRAGVAAAAEGMLP